MSFVEQTMREDGGSDYASTATTHTQEHSIICEVCGKKAQRIGRLLFHCARCEMSILLPQTLTIQRKETI